MNSKKSLYIIIAVLLITNLATLSYLLGMYRIGSYMGFGMMGSSEHWEEMIEHMEEEHDEMGMTREEVDYNKPMAETHNKSHDFGQISRESGVVSTTFEIENHGKKPLEIGEISTSCGCTTAEISKKTLGFNEETELIVYFDPNFHEEPQGKFSRSVFVETNDPDLPEMQFDIFVEILD